MANEKVNKVIYGGNTLIDLTADTVSKAKVLSGFTFHAPSGEIEEGTCTYDAYTSDATAGDSEVLATKTFYKNGVKHTGEMTNNGSVTGTISTVAGQYTIPQGYHDGSGKVGIASAEQQKIIPSNIKQGIVLLGVTGTYSGEAVAVQSNKNATPSSSSQVITPDQGYDYLAQVTVAAIPYNETINAAGGLTVTIG